MLRPARPPTPTLSPALGPTRDRQKPDGAPPQHLRELRGQAPSWRTLSLKLALQTLLTLLPLHGLPDQAGTATCPQGPEWTVPGTGLGPAHLCVCMRVVLPLLPPLARGCTHMACAHTLGSGRGPGAPT